MLDILLANRACPENYRIKPEEPKFKVGDWVRDLRDNSVFQINSVNFNLNLSITKEDRNRQLHNFMQYLTKPEPTTTELS